MNMGGTTDQGGFTVSLVRADHSSGDIGDGQPIYLGNPNGAIIAAKGEPAVYHLGDTDIFSDMALISEIYAPKVAMVPIGDRFTMGAKPLRWRSSASSMSTSPFPATTARFRSSRRRPINSWPR